MHFRHVLIFLKWKCSKREHSGVNIHSWKSRPVPCCRSAKKGEGISCKATQWPSVPYYISGISPEDGNCKTEAAVCEPLKGCRQCIHVDAQFAEIGLFPLPKECFSFLMWSNCAQFFDVNKCKVSDSGLENESPSGSFGVALRAWQRFLLHSSAVQYIPGMTRAGCPDNSLLMNQICCLGNCLQLCLENDELRTESWNCQAFKGDLITLKALLNLNLYKHVL